MKKILIILSFAVMAFVALPQSTHAVDSLDYYSITRNAITPVPCGTSESKSCPKEMAPIYEKLGEPCAKSFSEFSKFPTTRHFWIEDPAVTAQGKANERARQFIYWAVNNRAIDDHPVLKEIWGTTSSVAFFFVVVVAAFFGLGMIISRRTNFNLNMELWPTLIKIGVMLLYIALSASIVLLLIQLSEILMRFFIDNLGGKDLFNIYFTNTGSLGSSERNYTDFVGCRDLNMRVQEAIDTKFFLYKMTNITYYIMGTMIILRKILLWFLLFVSPFLALLMPFVFIRNIGWIWIGVFFQWLMYGPLFALFLGALSKIWKAGIPFTFDFSRVIPSDKFNSVSNGLVGYTYPTAMNILYGGPAQINSRKLSALNSGSYVDTFTEYVITLIMLWAVTFFPWWLLRIFRDYCCDGIYAMKNVLFAMYDEMRGEKNPKGPTPNFDLKSVLKIPTATEVDTKVNVRIASMEQIRKASSIDISKNMDLRVTKLTDIARLEANKTRMSTVRKNLAMLANPVKATTSAERQQYMNMRSELNSRALKDDAIARNMLASTSTSSAEREKIRQELVRDINKTISIKSSASISAETINELGRTIAANQKAGIGASSTVSLSNETLSSIASAANMSADKTKDVIQAYAKSNATSMNKAIAQLSKQFNISTEQIRTTINAAIAKQTEKTSAIMNTYMNQISNSDKMVKNIAAHSSLSAQQVRDIVAAYSKNMDKPANQVINNITNTTNISEAKVKDALTIMGTMFSTRNLILDFSEENKVEAEKVQAAVANVAKASGAGDTPEVGGPDGGGPEQPTETEAELQEAGKNGVPGKEAEAGAEEGIGGGPSPAPTEEERKLAAQVAEKAMEDEALLEQAGVKAKEVEQNKPAVVNTVIHYVAESNEAANEVVKEVAKQEDVKEEEAAQIVQEQLAITTKPEENIEKIVAVPPSVSIEEYEDLKEMWAQQYEDGEIPVTENIQSRDEWVETDIVTITNVMNKILSPNADLQQQGLDELGFIIPIFMINNLKGEQLITYLKAKLEAAKATRKLLDREKAIRAKIEKEKEDDEENLVEIKTKKEEAPIILHLDDEEQEKGKTIEEIGNTDYTQAPAEINPAYMEEQNKDSEAGSGESHREMPVGEPMASENSGEKEISWDQSNNSSDQSSNGAPLKEYGEEEENVMNKLKEYGDEPEEKEFND
jgi:hypothetical protein